MLYHSRKTLSAGEDGIVVEVRHVLLTLPPIHFPKKRMMTLYENLDQIKCSTDFPF